MDEKRLIKLILSDFFRFRIPKNYVSRFFYFFILIFYEGFRAVLIYRLCHCFRKVPVLKELLFLVKILFVKLEINSNANIGSGLMIAHPQCIVIGLNSKIGSNATLESGVTIGTDFEGMYSGGGYPCIGNNVSIGTGAKIIGPITIGDNCFIGANSVVTKDMPANSIIAGVPAKVLRSLAK